MIQLYHRHVLQSQYEWHDLTITILSMPLFSSVQHAENFPVASFLIPRALRHAVMVIYQFARSADDFADEGNITTQERLSALTSYQRQLDLIARKVPATYPLFMQLERIIHQHALPLSPFYDLLSAFCQDTQIQRYDNINQLFDYCQRSANPIGRLVLALHGLTCTNMIKYSDAVCTGLQLTNFCQDVSIDWNMGRTYIPQDELAAANLTMQDLSQVESSYVWQQLMQQQIARARMLLQAGRPLITALQQYSAQTHANTSQAALKKNITRGAIKRLSWELRLTIEGGLRILERIEQCNYRVFSQRPTLNAQDWLIIIWRGMRFCSAAK